uniref:hypothetical protein n=1 Tax=Cellulomonas sp. HZM TaxID=1454010 RepID=UPI000557DC7D
TPDPVEPDQPAPVELPIAPAAGPVVTDDTLLIERTIRAAAAAFDAARFAIRSRRAWLVEDTHRIRLEMGRLRSRVDERDADLAYIEAQIADLDRILAQLDADATPTGTPCTCPDPFDARLTWHDDTCPLCVEPTTKETHP